MKQSIPQLRQSHFAESRVEMLLEAVGCVGETKALRDARSASQGERRLTFAGFRARFGYFPMLLEASYLGGLAKRVRVADLFRRFDRNLLYDHYLEVSAQHEEEACGRAIGVVMPFGGLRGGIAIHNGTFDSGGSRLLHRIEGDSFPHALVAEPYRQLLGYLAAADWSPKRSDPDRWIRGAAAEPCLASAVAPWMVGRLGSGPAAIVLGWLHAVLASAASRDRVWIRRDEGGTRYVRATRSEIAIQTGLSEEAVKRGLAKLRTEGLVATARIVGAMGLFPIEPAISTTTNSTDSQQD